MKLKTELGSIAVAVASLFVGGAYAAAADPGEWKELVAKAASVSAVPVVIDVSTVSLVELKYLRAKVSAAVQSKAKIVLGELGNEAWAESADVSDAGQVSVYVTARGLAILKNSSNALSFKPGLEWHESTGLQRPRDGLVRIRSEAVAKGSANVVVTLNVEGLQFSHDAVGTVKFDAGKSEQASRPLLANALLQRVQAIQGARSVTELTKHASNTQAVAAGFDPTVREAVTERELIAMASSNAVRDVRLASDSDSYEAVYINPKSLQRAAVEGSVEVVVGLRTPVLRGHSSDKSDQAHFASVDATMNDIKARVSGTEGLQNLQGLNVMTGRISREGLASIVSSGDQRIASVTTSEVSFKPMLNVANDVTNTSLIWNTTGSSGFITGKGATIAVLDTGVKSDHAAFYTTNGATSRVTRQACFGTTDSVYLSPCPGVQTLAFDSFGSTSGEPLWCNGNSYCDHGTMVAGTAAGGGIAIHPATWQPLRSYAWEADIWSYNVYSRERSTNAVSLRGLDIMAAMNDLVTQMPSNGVVVFSYGTFQAFATTCNGVNAPPADRPVYDALQTAVNALYDRGIPVVVPTGNNSQVGAISAPACLDKVIKVTSMGNKPLSSSVYILNGNMYGNANVATANLPNNAQVSPGLTWIAAGGGELYNEPTGYGLGTSLYMPAVTASFARNSGTSFAAPQIAGLFALYKSAATTSTVPEIAAYFNSLSRTYLVQTFTPSPPSYPLYRKYNAIRMSAI